MNANAWRSMRTIYRAKIGTMQFSIVYFCFSLQSNERCLLFFVFIFIWIESSDGAKNSFGDDLPLPGNSELRAENMTGHLFLCMQCANKCTIWCTVFWLNDTKRNQFALYVWNLIWWRSFFLVVRLQMLKDVKNNSDRNQRRNPIRIYILWRKWALLLFPFVRFNKKKCRMEKGFLLFRALRFLLFSPSLS